MNLTEEEKIYDILKFMADLGEVVSELIITAKTYDAWIAQTTDVASFLRPNFPGPYSYVKILRGK